LSEKEFLHRPFEVRSGVEKALENLWTFVQKKGTRAVRQSGDEDVDSVVLGTESFLLIHAKICGSSNFL
jgi:hypothetical protein